MNWEDFPVYNAQIGDFLEDIPAPSCLRLADGLFNFPVEYVNNVNQKEQCFQAGPVIPRPGIEFIMLNELQLIVRPV